MTGRFLVILVFQIALAAISIFASACSQNGVSVFAGPAWGNDGGYGPGDGAYDSDGMGGGSPAPPGGDSGGSGGGGTGGPYDNDPIPSGGYAPPNYAYDLDEWMEGAAPDSVFLMLDRQSVQAGGRFTLFVVCRDNAYPMSNLNSLRISVNRDMARAEELAPGDFFRGFTGALITSPLSLQQPDFLDLNISWGGGDNMVEHRSGILAMVEFTALAPGTISFDIVERDSSQDRTFYSDFGGNHYFGTIGKDYDGDGDAESEVGISVV